MSSAEPAGNDEPLDTLEIFDGANDIRLTGYTTADIGVVSAISANDFAF